MAIVITKDGNTVRITVGDQEPGDVEILDPPTASRLFAESHMPFPGDIVRFVSPTADGTAADGTSFVDSIKVQGRDMPKTWKTEPGLFEFACSTGIFEYTVTVVGQDDSVTMVRGQT